MGIENKELTISLDDILAYSYLYVPILVFLLGWIRPYLAYPACTLLLLCTISGLHKKQIIIGNVFTQKAKSPCFYFLFFCFFGVFFPDREAWYYNLEIGTNTIQSWRI